MEKDLLAKEDLYFYGLHSLFVDNKKGKKFWSGMAWIKGKTRLFHSWRDLIISISLLRLGKFVQDSWLFCHHQIGEDCWVY
jgi:hypothetical protein